MKGKDHILQRLADRADLPGEPIPGQTVVEIAGESRVLIENYCAVVEYSRERIGIKVKYGAVLVCGRGLELRKMTKEQLVISGRIDGITLQRRGK